MIINIYDNKFNINDKVSWKCTIGSKNNEAIATINDYTKNNELIFKCDYYTEYREQLYFSMTSQKSRQLKQGLAFSEKQNAYFILTENDECVGKIIFKNSKIKGHLLLSYPYNVFYYKNRIYEFWEIGFGNEGYYFVVYENNKIIGIIEYCRPSSNDVPRYIIYLLEERLELLHLIPYWYIKSDYSRCDGNRHSNVRPASIWTPYKEIRDKFDPRFIEYVKSLENDRQSENDLC